MKLRRNRKIFPVSVSLAVYDYLKYLIKTGINASEAVDQAVRKTPEFKKNRAEILKKETNDPSGTEIGFGGS